MPPDRTSARQPQERRIARAAGAQSGTLQALLAEVRAGEDGTRQFKIDLQSPDSLAAEIVAFANAEGGTILIGVADNRTMPGLSSDDVVRINQLIANVASQSVRSPITVQTRNIPLSSGRIVVALKVPKGLDKPYFDRSGVIWLKSGADKRRLNSKEELRRLFQMSDQFHADALPTPATPRDLDMPRLRAFLRDTHRQRLPASRRAVLRLLRNMNLATEKGAVNLAGLLLFGEEPERHKPQFVIKAVHYPADTIDRGTYIDSEDFGGPLQRAFDGALAFLLRNLQKVQAGRGINSRGIPEIPPIVLEELLVNAMVHRDYLVSAPIRLFVFRDRLEIVSPGHLPNSLTVENIRTGNSNMRNPILASYAAKGVLPYRGLGSGVPRALRAWPHIELCDDREGTLFRATVRRPTTATHRPDGCAGPGSALNSERGSEISSEESSEIGSEESSEISSEIGSEKRAEKILTLLAAHPASSARGIAKILGVTPRAVERQIAGLKASGRLRRVGSTKGGFWQVHR